MAAPTTARDVAPTRVASDPLPTPDGLCLMCPEERGPVPRRHEDPFHARTCCEAWYAGELPRLGTVVSGYRA